MAIVNGYKQNENENSLDILNLDQLEKQAKKLFEIFKSAAIELK